MIPTAPTSTRRRLTAAILTIGLTLSLLLLPTLSDATGRQAPKPTVVHVHGAFADSSGWADVTTQLQRRGYPVLAVANPLRGVAADTAYLTSILTTIPGPIVLAGHSYGGEVITNAATDDPDVKALVYIAAFAPDKGETSGQLAAQFPGSQLTPDNLILRPYPVSGTTTSLDAYIDPADFRRIFAADLPASTTAAMAASQRPASVAALNEPSGAPAWKGIPSWYLVARQDQAIPPATQRFMADRINAHTREINSSHVAMTSHPKAVTDIINDAARTTR